MSCVVHMLVCFCLVGQLWAKCPCSPQLKHAPCIPLWVWASLTWATFPLCKPLPHPLPFPLSTLVQLKSIGTGWLFHDLGVVVELKGVWLNPCCWGCWPWLLWKHCPCDCQFIWKLDQGGVFLAGCLYKALMMCWEVVTLITFFFIWSYVLTVVSSRTFCPILWGRPWRNCCIVLWSTGL